jgi:hypothetical protein
MAQPTKNRFIDHLAEGNDAESFFAAGQRNDARPSKLRPSSVAMTGRSEHAHDVAGPTRRLPDCVRKPLDAQERLDGNVRRLVTIGAAL